MSKSEKKTILGQIFKGPKNKEPLTTSDDVIKDAKLARGKKEILKVIDKAKENGRITDTTLGDGAAIINNPEDNEKTLSESDFQVKKPDYEIEDLTKKEDISLTDVKPPLETDIDINKILKSLDGKLDEKQHNHILNILTTRSSKSDFKESALIEYSIYNKSYVMSLIVEKEDNSDKYRVLLNSSYGKSIYNKENVELNNILEAVAFPFDMIALRDKAIKEEVSSIDGCEV